MKPISRATLTVCAVSVGSALSTASALAQDSLEEPRGAWVDVIGTAFVGDGLRLNNPYRLSTVLGSDAHSISRTATYADVGGALTWGDPARFAQGIAVRASFAIEGLSQPVVTPSYLIFHRWAVLATYARGGVAVALMPDVTWGLEAGAGAVWFARGGVGLALELVGDLFYGAGTREVATPAYPVLSAQGGLWLSWEAMP